MSEQNKSVVRRIVEDHWNKKNHSLVGEVFASTVSLNTPDGVLNGLDGASRLLEAYANAFPDFRLSIDDLLSDGDQVVLRWTFGGTHRGPLAGVAATGRTVQVPGIGIFRVRGNKADHADLLWNKYLLLQQLGALPMQSTA
jgi:steroid delta-isomerase-like uncharacterized protein